MRCTPAARERVEVRRQRGDERLALAGLHLGDPAEVQRGAAHQLHVEVALAEHAAAGLAHGREGLGEQVVEQVGDELLAVLGVLARGPGLVDLLAELVGAGPELVVGQPLDLGLERVDLGNDRLDRLEAAALTGVEDLLNDAHAIGESTGAGPVRSRSGCVHQLLAHRVHGRLHAAPELQLLENVAHVVLHRVLGDHELGGDVLVRQAARHEPEHLELAVAEPGRVAALLLDPARQRVELAEQPRRHRRRDQAVAARDRAHRLGQLLDRDLLQEVARSRRRAPRRRGRRRSPTR